MHKKVRNCESVAPIGAALIFILHCFWYCASKIIIFYFDFISRHGKQTDVFGTKDAALDFTTEHQQGISTVIHGCLESF